MRLPRPVLIATAVLLISVYAALAGLALRALHDHSWSLIY